jgi:sugar lactone lactonase YvrE
MANPAKVETTTMATENGTGNRRLLLPIGSARSAIVLAGGDGTRLRELTRQIAGDDRPKQFCRLVGQETLIDETRRRVARSVSPARTFFSVTTTHARFYAPLLADVRSRQIVAQPGNRGTAPAILYALLRLAAVAPHDPVAILPSDHYVSDDAEFMAHVDAAFDLVTARPELVTLLGITPDRPETEYGWIEPAPAIAGPRGRPFHGVRRFWEKPDAALARTLLADGFLFTEGPVWVPRNGTTEGYLLFSDPNANTIYRWASDGQVSVFRTKSGYAGVDVAEYAQPGSNGLTLDREGRLTINEHGNRRVVRLERTGAVTVLADRFQGQRLNSPNDLVYRSDGALYFTDPPFGLPKAFDDPRKELPSSGVFCLIGGELKRISTDLAGPNGLAFSPDERYLYVGNWDPAKKVVMRYDVRPDGSLAAGRVFFDMTSTPGDDAIDGIKVDQRGNLYVSGPGGLWILSAEGTHLGTLKGPEHPHNLAWGDDDGRTLYLTAQTGLYRIRLNVAGIRP